MTFTRGEFDSHPPGVFPRIFDGSWGARHVSRNCPSARPFLCRFGFTRVHACIFPVETEKDCHRGGCLLLPEGASARRRLVRGRAAATSFFSIVFLSEKWPGQSYAVASFSSFGCGSFGRFYPFCLLSERRLKIAAGFGSIRPSLPLVSKYDEQMVPPIYFVSHGTFDSHLPLARGPSSLRNFFFPDQLEM